MVALLKLNESGWEAFANHALTFLVDRTRPLGPAV
jgi:hypothetical protein